MEIHELTGKEVTQNKPEKIRTWNQDLFIRRSPSFPLFFQMESEKNASHILGQLIDEIMIIIFLSS